MKNCPNCGKEIDPQQKYCCARCYCEHTGNKIYGVDFTKQLGNKHGTN